MADLFTKYNCTNCQDDITGIRVHCAECTSFDLCLQCFAAGAEIGEHSNSHSYQFMDTGTAILSIFRGKGSWSAREELRLLDAIEKYGFGNWEDISKHIETKSPEDAREEYVNKYLNGTIGRHTWIPAETQRPQLVDHTEEDTGPLGKEALQKLPPLDITPEECTQLGYMPNRDSFEREYDPTAEQLISSLSLNVDDTEADYLLKLAHVDMYIRRLRERVRRKRIVRDYQLVANFFRNKNHQQHPRMSPEQRDFRDRFRVFAQFCSANEYERLLASLEREKELRIRLSELCRYRWNGLTKIDECRHFEQHAAALQQNTGPFGNGKTDNLNTGNHRPGFSSHSPHNKKIETTNGSEEKPSSTGERSMPLTADPTCSDESSLNKSSSDSYQGLSGHTTNKRSMTPTSPQPQLQITTNQSSNQAAPHHLKSENQPDAVEDAQSNPEQQQLDAVNQQHQQQQEQQQEQVQTTLQQEHSQAAMSSILRSQLDQLKNLQQPIGSNLLSSNEMQLCSVLNLPPTNYLSLKTIILSGAPLSSNLSLEENSIRKYLIKAGWLSH